MNKEEIIIALCDMIVKLTKDIDKIKDQADKSSMRFSLIGVRKELLDIVTSSKEEESIVL